MTATATTRPDPDAPPGWSYNPSSGLHRAAVAGLALLGLAIASYLTLYQLGAFADVWDPIFGSASSAAILNSAVARWLPVPDASLGALVYLIDAAGALVGGRRRWRTMPWLVFAVGAVAGGAALGSVVLVVLQPLAFRAWCTLCLASAVLSLAIAVPMAAEVWASWISLREARRRGLSLGRALTGG